MIARYLALAQRIRLELGELEHTVTVIERHWKQAKNAKRDQDAFLNSVKCNWNW